MALLVATVAEAAGEKPHAQASDSSLFCPFFLARTLKSHNVLLGTSKDRKCPIIVQTLKDKAICMHGSDVFTIKITKIWRFAPLPYLLKLLSEQLLVE